MNQNLTHEQRFAGPESLELRKRIVKRVMAFGQGRTSYRTIDGAIMALRHSIAFTPLGLATLRQVADDYVAEWLPENRHNDN